MGYYGLTFGRNETTFFRRRGATLERERGLFLIGSIVTKKVILIEFATIKLNLP